MAKSIYDTPFLKDGQITIKVNPPHKLQVLGGGNGFYKWILGGKSELFGKEEKTCPRCCLKGSGEQIANHDCKFEFGE